MTDSFCLNDDNAGLFTDLYQLTMLQSYVKEDLTEDAVFSLFVRDLPEQRNYLIACGLNVVLGYLEDVHFSDEALEFLADQDEFHADFIEYLADFEFTGDVFAVREGTPVFPDEPILEVKAPLPEAQLVETLILNQVHFQTVLASKARRVAEAAGNATVVDFGMRRMHGSDAAVKAARAFYIAGVAATSNVLAGEMYGIPITGTMAHSYIEAHENEQEAFRAFARLYPETVLLVDTYDTLNGVRHVIDLARELGDDFQVRAIRLDSGDLGDLARQSRQILDEAGLEGVDIFASGGLDEFKISALRETNAPIDGFGVGTRMGVSEDAPALDSAYKMVRYAGKDRLKLSSGKSTLPGRKQVFRHTGKNNTYTRDTIGLHSENVDGTPLLQPVMRNGQRLEETVYSLDEIRSYAEQTYNRLPDHIRQITPVDQSYPVELSDRLVKHRDDVVERIRASAGNKREGTAI